MKGESSPYRFVLRAFALNAVLGSVLASVGFGAIHGVFDSLATGRHDLATCLISAQNGALLGAIGGGIIGLGNGLFGLVIALAYRVRAIEWTWYGPGLAVVVFLAIFLSLGVAVLEILAHFARFHP
jgi:hypothetical protein